MMMSKRIQPWRWWVKVLQALLVLGIPFLEVKGQSALRFDVPTLTLHVFGAKVGMDEFFLVLIAVLFLGFLLALLTTLFGRIWCGWLCPQTVIIDFTRFIDRPAAGRRSSRVAALVALLLISVVLAASLLWYFVSPYEFISRLTEWRLGRLLGWSWAILTLVTFLNFAFLRHGFCTTVCPYAKMQGALYDDRTLIIGPDPSRMETCMHCDACVNACPVQIDVREGPNAACINCAECIDACVRQMDRRGLASLIDYRFGYGRTGGTSLRRGVVLSALAAAVFLALFAYLTVSRLPLDLSVAADPTSPPRRTVSGDVVNTYVLSFTNRTDADMTVTLSSRMGGTPLVVHPERIDIPPDSHMRSVIEVLGEMGMTERAASRTIRIAVEPLFTQRGRIEVETAFLPPW